jgi:GT2 family glycosyltransferase
MMRLAACITTRNRTKELNVCLSALWNSTVKPHSVIVSDDSLDPDVQQENFQVVQRYPNTTYLKGPHNGVCGNRNNAVNAVTDVELVGFVDDDIYVEPDFIKNALECYAKIPSQDREHIILTGISYGQNGQELLPGKLTFRGYFCSVKESPETVVIHAAIFPRVFFDQEQWDENIFFGYEDAELCLRALKRGYQVLFASELRVKNACFLQGTLVSPSIDNLTEYEIYIEAARLYVGIKRYKDLFPNVPKLLLFIIIYFLHMTIYLLRRRSLKAFPEILRRSNIKRLGIS